MKTFLQVLLSLNIFFALPALANDGPTIESQMTTEVRNTMPVDNISSADTTTHKTFLWSSIHGCTGCTVSHVWYLDGNMIYRYQTTVRYNRTSWWTTRPGSGTGEWTAEVLVDNQPVETLALQYGAAREAQTYVINKQLKKRESSECQDKLDYFREQARTNDDPYVKFMIRKLTARCN